MFGKFLGLKYWLVQLVFGVLITAVSSSLGLRHPYVFAFVSGLVSGFLQGRFGWWE